MENDSITTMKNEFLVWKQMMVPNYHSYDYKDEEINGTHLVFFCKRLKNLLLSLEKDKQINEEEDKKYIEECIENYSPLNMSSKDLALFYCHLHLLESCQLFNLKLLNLFEWLHRMNIEFSIPLNNYLDTTLINDVKDEKTSRYRIILLRGIFNILTQKIDLTLLR